MKLLCRIELCGIRVVTKILLVRSPYFGVYCPLSSFSFESSTSQKNYALAVTESTKALELDPNYVKALMRRAQANEKLDKFEEALTGMYSKLRLNAI